MDSVVLHWKSFLDPDFDLDASFAHEDEAMIEEDTPPTPPQFDLTPVASQADLSSMIPPFPGNASAPPGSVDVFSPMLQAPEVEPIARQLQFGSQEVANRFEPAGEASPSV